MRVLSLFDGISCGMVALERAGIEVDKYYASEIDNHAIKVSKHNYPNICHLGDIYNWKEWNIDFSNINLVIGGSPCQSISNLGDGSGLKGKSGLFYKFYEILEHVKELNPSVKFLLENVRGKKEAIDKITELMGVNPVHINSSLFSAQNRNRLYWTNIDFPDLPKNDSDVKLKDVLENGVPELSVLTDGRKRWLLSEKGKKTIEKGYAKIDPDKAGCLTARSDASWNSNYITRNGEITRLTPVEYERLQTLPDGYTACIPTSKRYQVIGNAWTVDVIAHIFSGLREENNDY